MQRPQPKRTFRFTDPSQPHPRPWEVAPADARHLLARNLAFKAMLGYGVWHEGDKPLYAQPLLLEYGGAATIAVSKEGTFPLVWVERPYVTDFAAYRAAFPNITDAMIGCAMLEAARGMSKRTENWSETARREFEEETKLRVLGDPIPLWMGVPNSTFIAQPTMLYLLRVDGAPAATPPDELEGITDRPVWVSLDTYLELRKTGEIVDMYTDSAPAPPAGAVVEATVERGLGVDQHADQGSAAPAASAVVR